MSLAEFLGLLANFATCVAAFIALFALWEVKKQRASTYQPDLAPIRRPFFYMAHNFDMSVMSRWVTDPPADFNWESLEPEPKSRRKSKPATPVLYERLDRPYSIPLVNLGNGAAKSVHIEWDWPIAGVLVDVNRLCLRHKIPMSFEIENDTMEIKGQHTYVNLSMKSQFLDYCLPASIEHAVDRLMVPAWYIYATSIYLFLLTIDEGHGEKTDVPELLLTLRYRDIGGEAHKRRFGIKASLGFLTQNPESKRVALRGMLEPRQLSD